MKIETEDFTVEKIGSRVAIAATGEEGETAISIPSSSIDTLVESLRLIQHQGR